MDSLETQELVRELITEADHLSRTAHDANDHTRSGRFAALRSTLQRLERRLGGDSSHSALAGELDVVYQRIRDLASQPANYANDAMPHGEETPGEREDLAHLLAQAKRLRPVPRSVLSRDPAPRALASEREDTRVLSMSLALGGLAALAVPLLVPALRRSRAAWGVVVAVALASLAGVVAVESRPTGTPL